MIKNTFTVAALVVTACLALAGCASSMNTASNQDFACGGQDSCPTPFEVYNQTNHTPTSVNNGRTPTNWKAGARAKGEGKPTANAGTELRMDLAVIAPSSKLDLAIDPPPQPLREPSQVMRIWLAPWTDQNDTLNWSGYVYTEITTRRWAFGEQEVRQQGLPPQFLPR